MWTDFFNELPLQDMWKHKMHHRRFRLTSAKFSDVDKKVYPSDECYQLQISTPEGLKLDGDIHKSQKGETVEDLIKLFIQNGCKYYKLRKIDDKWTKVSVDE